MKFPLRSYSQWLKAFIPKGVTIVDIQERRARYQTTSPNCFKFRKKSSDEFMTGTVYEEAFDATEIFASAGSREIMAIFKAGEKHTPQDRAFDFYLPVDIKIGSYSLEKSVELIFTEYVESKNLRASYQSYRAHSGNLNIEAILDQTVYSGSFNATFNKRNDVEVTAKGTFAFLISRS